MKAILEFVVKHKLERQKPNEDILEKMNTFVGINYKNVNIYGKSDVANYLPRTNEIVANAWKDLSYEQKELIYNIACELIDNCNNKIKEIFVCYRKINDNKYSKNTNDRFSLCLHNKIAKQTKVHGEDIIGWEYFDDTYTLPLCFYNKQTGIQDKNKIRFDSDNINEVFKYIKAHA